jgi:hypothetical protein
MEDDLVRRRSLRRMRSVRHDWNGGMI